MMRTPSKRAKRAHFLRRAAYLLSYRDGEPFPVELPEGRCMLIFPTREAAFEWAEVFVPAHMRIHLRAWTLASLEQVERLFERWRGEFQIVSFNPAPDVNATPFYDPLEAMLERARQEVRR